MTPKKATKRARKAAPGRPGKTPSKRGTRALTPSRPHARTEVLYAYGFVRDGFDIARAPTGLDDVPIELVSRGPHAALVSRLPVSLYSSEQVEEQSGDVQWLTPRARAHDLVLTWAQEHGGVIPLPMFSLWGSNRALEGAIVKRAPELKRVFAKVQGADEFGVRVYRRDAALLENIDAVDAGIAALKREAAAASPGQRYLLERKIADEAKQSMRSASLAMAKEVYERLRPLARAALARPLVPDSGRAQEATLVLNGAFLVDRATLDAFRAAVGEVVRVYQPRGLTFDFTGPWPPYNFVGRDGAGNARRASK
jgi:hypothetical protein